MDTIKTQATKPAAKPKTKKIDSEAVTQNALLALLAEVKNLKAATITPPVAPVEAIPTDLASFLAGETKPATTDVFEQVRKTIENEVLERLVVALNNVTIDDLRSLLSD
jgi:hypothetical protein